MRLWNNNDPDPVGMRWENEHSAPQLASSLCSNTNTFFFVFLATLVCARLCEYESLKHAQTQSWTHAHTLFCTTDSLHYSAHSRVSYYPISWQLSSVQFLQNQQFNSLKDTVHQFLHIRRNNAHHDYQLYTQHELGSTHSQPIETWLLQCRCKLLRTHSCMNWGHWVERQLICNDVYSLNQRPL